MPQSVSGSPESSGGRLASGGRMCRHDGYHGGQWNDIRRGGDPALFPLLQHQCERMARGTGLHLCLDQRQHELGDEYLRVHQLVAEQQHDCRKHPRLGGMAKRSIRVARG